ncbi:hypothetical protein [Cryptosporangium aurantiacum]|uniref:Uncharacterized protein n=1 Tax=Cryptosporangium aurantiacum TaxID=134849 RepID=A0A1M7RI05_9ACTN|nr:hypothetical protein [Cryptosporangium aurantiacum]SHN45850.1 hypothetical protein SAMN05443668_11343 [Cryptosporangium aurantiacum]
MSELTGASRGTGALDEAALWAARARAEGPLLLPPGVPAPEGFRRLVEPGATGAWWVPVGPDAVTPAALRDLRLGLPTLDHRNEASRVLAVCLRCCWTDLAAEPWPGRPTTVAAVLAVLAELLPTRSSATHHRFAVEAFRQLAESGWLRWEERAGTIRLGPRVATWAPAETEALRELCRTMPLPPATPAPAEPAPAAAPAEPAPDAAGPAVARGVTSECSEDGEPNAAGDSR